MDERADLLMKDYMAGRYTRRQVMQKALRLGLAASVAVALRDLSEDRPTAGSLTAAEAASAQRSVVVGIPETTERPDPPLCVEYGDITVINNNINEGIVRTKSGTTEIEPSIATTWDISPDGLRYTFHLRSATFHDGTPATAEAVKFSYERQMDEKNPYHFSGETMTDVVFGNIKAIDAVDSKTLRISQTRPDVALLANMALWSEGLVSPAALKKYGQEYLMHPTGTGPYRFERWEKGVQFVMGAYDKYWGGRPMINRVIWKTVADNTVRLEQLRSRELDIMTELDFKNIADVKNDKRFQVITGNILQNQYMMLNGHHAPFDNRDVRQAVHFAINKANIGKVIFYGNYEVGAGPLMPGQSGYDKTLAGVYPHDPGRAKALLQKAGAAGDVPVTLITRNNRFWPEEAQLVQADLQAVGLKVTIQQLDDASFFGQLNASAHQMALNDWTNDTGDPSNPMVTQFSSKRAMARMAYNNPQVDKLNAAAQVERDPAKRRDLYIRAQRLILEDAHYVVLGYPRLSNAARADIKGLAFSPLRDLVFRGVTAG